MTIPYGFHEGNRSEYLAAYFLSKIGLVIPVPRQLDLFKVDFIVHLCAKKERNFVPTGRCFAIQIKSNHDPLEVESKDLERFWESNFPYFIGVVSKKGQKFTIYATLPRLVYMWMVGRDQEFRLNLGGGIDEFHKADWKDQEDKDVKDVWTGPPILELDTGRLEGTKTKEACLETFLSVMDSWVDFEASSLAWKNRYIPVVELPHTFKSDEPASRSPTFTVRGVANPNSFPAICQAVHAPLFSLGLYLHDLVDRAVLPAPLELQANEVDSALECVKDGVTDLGPKVAAFLHSLADQRNDAG